MSQDALIRLGVLIVGLVLLAAIYFFGRPKKPSQGRRLQEHDDERPIDRKEPTLGSHLQSEYDESNYTDEERAAVQGDLSLFDRNLTNASVHNMDYGKRVNEDFDKIVTLYIAARAGEILRGPDIVVAAEKAGLTYGYMNVYHRLIDGHPERGPIFSVANIKNPGSFDMETIQELETPAIAFFLTLPAPDTALSSWDGMLPVAQRMAELLDGVVLDEHRNALGRQRIAGLRDEMRAYDRQHEASVAPPANTRW